MPETASNSFLTLTPTKNPISNPDFASGIGSWEAGADVEPADIPANWAPLAPYGSLGAGNDNFNTPGQVAVTSTHVFIADTANNRLVQRLRSTGAFVAQITGLTGITGVCVDASGNIYVAYTGFTRSYTSALALRWTQDLGGQSLNHLTTDGTHFYGTFNSFSPGHIIKYLCSTGAAVVGYGTVDGAGNGQFASPTRGIVFGGGELYVVDAGNNRVQVFNTTGVYQRQWAIPANSRGITIDGSGNVWVAVHGSDQLRRYSNTGALQETISQANPDGVAAVSTDELWASNADDDNLVKWIFTATIVGAITGVRSWDAAIGGVANGSHKTEITVNTGAAGGSVQTISSNFFPCNGRSSVNLSAWVTTDDADVIPRLRLIFAGDDETTISSKTEPVWSPVANTGYTRVLAAEVPPRATKYRIGLVAYAAAAGATGSVHFDDLDLNGNFLIVTDAAGDPNLEITVEIRGAWL